MVAEMEMIVTIMLVLVVVTAAMAPTMMVIGVVFAM